MKTETFAVRWSHAATRDLSQLIDFTAANFERRQARSLYRDLRRRLASLKTHPNRCRRIPELSDLGLEYRELLAGNYRIPFRIYDAEVVLLGVLDGRRDLEELLLQRLLDG